MAGSSLGLPVRIRAQQSHSLFKKVLSSRYSQRMEFLQQLLEQRRGLATRIIVAQTLFLALIWFGTVDFTGVYAGADLAQYKRMAAAAPSFDPSIPAPFAYRIAVPFVVGVLFPQNNVPGFQLLHLVLVLALAIQFFRVLRQYGANEAYALVAVTLVVWNPYLGGFLMFNPFQAGDTLAYLLLLVALEAYRKRSALVFGIALILAATVRETPLLIVPAAAFALRKDTRMMLRFMIAALPALAVFVMIRMLIPSSNPQWSILSTLADYAPDAISPERWGRMLINTCAPLSLLVMTIIRKNWKDLGSYPAELSLMVALTAASFTGGDVERLLSPVLLLLLIVLRPYVETYLKNARFNLALAIAVPVCANHFIYARYGSFLPNTAYYALSLASSMLVAWTAYRATSSGSETALHP